MLGISLIRLPVLVRFAASIVAGILLSIFIHNYSVNISSNLMRTGKNVTHRDLYRAWLMSLNTSAQPQQTEASLLEQRVRVLCFVVFDPQSSEFSAIAQPNKEERHLLKRAASAAAETWGKRCSKLVYMSTSLRLRISGVTMHLITNHPTNDWRALREILIKISNDYIDDYDWFLYSELRSYVILENLRYYLSVFDPSLPHYLGHVISGWLTPEYNTYHGGFVLSNNALRQLQDVFGKGRCGAKETPGDMELGRCLSELSIYTVDTRDNAQRGRFIPSSLDRLLSPEGRSWWRFWEGEGAEKYQLKQGTECCSDYAVTFHMDFYYSIYVMEYFVYHLRPYDGRPSLSSFHDRHLVIS